MGKRYRLDETLNKPDDFVAFIMNDFFIKNGFQYKVYKGEGVWQEGGTLAAPKFFKYSYMNGILHIEAWLKFLWLPGVYSGEMGLKGFWGAAVKRIYQAQINGLLGILHQPLPNDYNGAVQGNQNQMAQKPIEVQVVDNVHGVGLGLFFSILGLVFCWSPLFCFIFGSVGISFSVRCRHSTKHGMATAGLVIGIAGLAIMAVLFFMSLMGNALSGF